MKIYTYKDWLSDKFNLKSDWITFKMVNGIWSYCYKNFVLGIEDYDKIRKAQQEAFDASFTMAFESYKKCFLGEISRAQFPDKYLEKQRNKYKQDINNIPSGILTGFKYLDGITGSQYLEMKTALKGFKAGEIKYTYVINYLTDYLKMYTVFRIHEWLIEEYPIQEQPGSRTELDIKKTEKDQEGDPFNGLTNKFNKMPLYLVRKYFMQLNTVTNKKKEPFLTVDSNSKVDEVVDFIKKAFCKVEGIDKLSINYTRGEKMYIMQLFYNYYIICTSNYQYDEMIQYRDKYIRLLSNNFNNWDFNKLKNNFQKSKNSLKKWPISELKKFEEWVN